MNPKPLFTNRRYLGAAALTLCFILIVASHPWRSAAVATDAQTEKLRLARENSAKFQTLLRRGVGSELSFAERRDSNGNIRASIESLDSFISNRSGLSFDKETKQRLAALEENVLSGAGRRIPPGDLTAILAESFVERVRTATDSEIEQAAETFCEPQVGDTSTSATRCLVKLRANGFGLMRSETFIERAKAFRSHLGIPALSLALTAQMREFIGQEVEQRLHNLSAAMPTEWGKATTEGITPAQALLIAYSEASDDYLWYSQQDLRQIEEALVQSAGKARTVASSRSAPHAYGTEGYIYTSPIHLMFDRQMTRRLLDRFEERSAR